MRTENLRENKMATFKYFSGDVELVCIKPVNNDVFASMGGVKTKHNRYDCYNRIVGATTIEINANKVWLPVTHVRLNIKAAQVCISVMHVAKTQLAMFAVFLWRKISWNKHESE